MVTHRDEHHATAAVLTTTLSTCKCTVASSVSSLASDWSKLSASDRGAGAGALKSSTACVCDIGHVLVTCSRPALSSCLHFALHSSYTVTRHAPPARSTASSSSLQGTSTNSNETYIWHATTKQAHGARMRDCAMGDCTVHPAASTIAPTTAPQSSFSLAHGRPRRMQCVNPGSSFRHKVVWCLLALRMCTRSSQTTTCRQMPPPASLPN
jgi:hypothetical protein